MVESSGAYRRLFPRKGDGKLATFSPAVNWAGRLGLIPSQSDYNLRGNELEHERGNDGPGDSRADVVSIGV